MSPREQQSPDYIAHQFVTNVGAAIRVHLQGNVARIPVSPYRGDDSPHTETVPVASFYGVIEDAEIVDGGLTLFGVNGLHLPRSEWRRIGLQKHWEADDADLECPYFPPQRKLEVWASREDNLYRYGTYENASYEHLERVPDESPLITEWREQSPDHLPDKPPVPFSRPSVTVETLRAVDVSDTRGLNRVEVATIESVELLGTLDERPIEPKFGSRDVTTPSQPPKHLDIDYDRIPPLPQEDRLLFAVHTVNRHAKKLGEKAKAAYQWGSGAEASVYSFQKKALYTVKTIALHRLVKDNPERVDLEHHVLNGNFDTICFYFGIDYSFHNPLEAVDEALIADVTGAPTIDALSTREFDIQSQPDIEHLDQSLTDALQLLAEYGINANDHLQAESVTDFDWDNQLSTSFYGLD